jgi:uncharacterized protein YqhQ
MAKEKKQKNPRLGKVGGQAVLEGVMMKSGDRCSLAVRDENGKIKVESTTFVSARKKNKLLNLPIIRGVVNMVEMLRLSYSTMERSAAMLGIDDFEEVTKFDRWLKEKLGDKLMKVLMGVAMVLGVALAVALFVVLPIFATGWIEKLTGELGWWKNVISGVMKIVIFIVYLLLTSLMTDIRRTYEYHGAEHKSVACYEAGLPLTPENAAKCTRFHPRCGTSFIFVVLVISILVYSLVSWNINKLLMILLRLLLLPIVVGLGFELIMLSGKHPNAFTNALAAPGLWMQRITTREPDEKQLEVALTALRHAMPNEFPEVLEEEKIMKAENKAEAEADAEKAKSDVENAEGNAENAEADAENVEGNAENAEADAENAEADAENAEGNAEEADVKKADEAEADAENAEDDAENEARQ